MIRKTRKKDLGILSTENALPKIRNTDYLFPGPGGLLSNPRRTLYAPLQKSAYGGGLGLVLPACSPACPPACLRPPANFPFPSHVVPMLSLMLASQG